jgi:hypothetical protein
VAVAVSYWAVVATGRFQNESTANGHSHGVRVTP